MLQFLERRIGLLDGVVFSGGEPTLQAALPAAINTLRSLGYEIGLHTAGAFPQRLRSVLPLVDWVGFDIKATAEDYPALTGARSSADQVLESAALLLESGVDYEFRTTVHPALMDATTLRRLARMLAEMGVKNYVLQECISGHCLDESLREARPTWALSPALAEEIGALFPGFSLRRAGVHGKA